MTFKGIRFRGRSAGLSLSLCALALLAGCSQSEPQGGPQTQPLKVGVYTVAVEPLTLTTSLPGRIDAFRVAEVRPQVSGIIQKRLFTEGTVVKEGQQLYQIDPAPYQAALLRAEANLLSAKNLAQRYEKLIKTRAISQQQYDNAVAAWKSAEAELEVARINMRYTKVLSPITGRIGRSAVTEGALVTNGQPNPLAIVHQRDPVYVDVTQSVTQMLRLRSALEQGLLKPAGNKQAEVGLTLEDGSLYPLKGTLKFSEVNVDESTGSVTLRAIFPNPDGKLLPGMFVHATLQEGVQQDAMLVPQQAVFRDTRGEAMAWVVKSDNTVEARQLETLRTVGNFWLIGAGLTPGERVVTEGIQALRAGSKVTPVKAGNVKPVKTFAPTAE